MKKDDGCYIPANLTQQPASGPKGMDESVTQYHDKKPVLNQGNRLPGVPSYTTKVKGSKS